jgi:hypothetical protein
MKHRGQWSVALFSHLVFVATSLHGASLREAIALDDTLSSFAPQMTVDDVGVIHAVFHSDVNSGRGYSFVRYTQSSDGGESWMKPIAVPDTSTSRLNWAIRPVVRPGQCMVVWQDRGDNIGVWCSIRADSDKNFGSAISIVPPHTLPGAPFLINAVLMPSGRVLVLFMSNRSSTFADHRVVWSDDFGMTWSSTQIVDVDHPSRGGALGDLSIGLDGSVYVAYTGTDQVLRCYRSTDGGNEWAGNPIAPIVGTSLTSVVAAGDRVGVAYHDEDSDGLVTTKFVVSSDGGLTWTSPVELPLGGPVGNYYQPVLAALPEGQWAATMLWNEPFSPYVDLYYTSSKAGGSLWAPLCRINAGAVDPLHHDLRMSHEGRPCFVWAEGQSPAAYKDILFTTDDQVLSTLTTIPQSRGRFALYPETNPTQNAPTALVVHLPDRAPAEVFLRDTSGRLVRRWRHEQLEQGENHLSWDGRDQDGRIVAPGVYFWEVRAERPQGVQSLATRIVIVR